MAKEKEKSEMCSCPVGRIFSDLEKISWEKSKFFCGYKLFTAVWVYVIMKSTG